MNLFLILSIHLKQKHSAHAFVFRELYASLLKHNNGRATPYEERMLFPDNFLSVFYSPICEVSDYGL